MWASKLIIDSFIYVFFNYYFLFKGSNQFMGSDQTIPQKNYTHGQIQTKSNETKSQQKKFTHGQINEYTLHEILGHGSYGLVYLAESPKKKKFALKKIKISSIIQNYCIQQAEAYVSLNHPNILKAREYFLYKQQMYLVIVLQYCPDGDLSKFIGKLTQNSCMNIMKQIAEGLVYIHNKHLTHRDIKPQNILMMNGVPKIADFGLARSMSSAGASTKIGTPFYMAPQIYWEQKYDQNRRYLADVWSLGILFFELLLGKRIDKMIEGEKRPCLRQNFPPDDLLNKIKNQKLRTLIYHMLEKDPDKRLSSTEVLKTLQDDEFNMLVEKRQPVKFKNGIIYDGEWKGKVREGFGVQIWPEGAKYEGQWFNNKAEGKGKFTHVDGDIYDGDWKQDKASGYGVYVHNNGIRYQGQWLIDYQHGYGVQTWIDGSKYEGNYKEGKKNGEGKYTWKDGSYYTGNWVDNKITGFGLYVWADGRTYKGDWLNNQMHGRGTYTWKDGRKYQGEYQFDKKHGVGTYTWKDGMKYVGQWKNSKRHGIGKIISVDGSVREGVWQNDVRISDTKRKEHSLSNFLEKFHERAEQNKITNEEAEPKLADANLSIKVQKILSQSRKIA